MIVFEIVGGGDESNETHDTAPESIVDFAEAQDAVRGKRRKGALRFPPPVAEATSLDDIIPPLPDGIVAIPGGIQYPDGTTVTEQGGTKKPAKEKKVKEPKEPKAKKAKAGKPAKAPRENKTDTLVLMLLDDKGATTDEVAKAFGWLAHTTRAAISTLPKKKQFPDGHVLSKEKVEERGLVYRIVKA
ncbi:DUF3489 domain-containing protein [Sinorhizobium fredii]|uniref:DUF3489 domain-containing protein n=1 Tax=Rhizobium fredii TaxID=380 RepID=UPI003097DE9B